MERSSEMRRTKMDSGDPQHFGLRFLSLRRRGSQRVLVTLGGTPVPPWSNCFPLFFPLFWSQTCFFLEAASLPGDSGDQDPL